MPRKKNRKIYSGSKGKKGSITRKLYASIRTEIEGTARQHTKQIKLAKKMDAALDKINKKKKRKA